MIRSLKVVALKYADRLDQIQPFRVMKLLARANELQALGRPIVHMEVGEPDFPTPQVILDAGRRAISSGLTKYTPAQGIPELRRAISTFYQTQYNADIPSERIFITAGGSAALLMATALTMNVGEGLLMSDPGYPCNRHFLTTLGAHAELVPVSADTGYQLNRALIANNWRKTSRGVLLASPSNPTGSVISRAGMVDIADEVSSRQGHLIVDEIYHGLDYSDEKLHSVVEISDHCIVVNSFSKYFGMTGWRLGWMVVPEFAINGVEKLAQNLFICPSSIAQYAALAAFSDEGRAEMDRNRSAFKQRRDYLLGALKALGFGIPIEPSGAFYIYARLPEGSANSEAFCHDLLERYSVAVTPGTDFGHFDADHYVRFSYAQDIELLRQGVKQLKQALTT
ncbi:MAG: aminotransferase class I/II-fold pyridoxal phosphate-dependent enzyme [Pseudomonadales bacterium]|nr:aminotransferase class I/II-fold pyridoxal phosphate-dependent enzyme [Pseudomonadales bacterium]